MIEACSLMCEIESTYHTDGRLIFFFFFSMSMEGDSSGPTKKKRRNWKRVLLPAEEMFLQMLLKRCLSSLGGVGCSFHQRGTEMVKVLDFLSRCSLGYLNWHELRWGGAIPVQSQRQNLKFNYGCIFEPVEWDQEIWQEPLYSVKLIFVRPVYND